MEVSDTIASSCVPGYHICKDVWDTVTGEEL